MEFAMRKRLLRRPALRLLGSFLLLMMFSAPSGAMGAGAVTEFALPTAAGHHGRPRRQSLVHGGQRQPDRAPQPPGVGNP